MKYLETKHERNSAKITTLIVVILLLLLFVVGPPYMDPPIEYGVAVNFGNSPVGEGNVQPKKPVKSEPQEVQKPVEEVSESKLETSAPASSEKVKTEDVLNQENQEAIAIKKQKEAERNAKLEAERKAKAEADAGAKAEAERIAKEKAEQEAKKKKLDALIGGVSKSEGTETGGEGDDKASGDKGQLDGDPYAPSYFGSSGSGKGGVGYGLNGRGRPSNKTYKQNCNEYGLVVVRIEVDKNGNVTKAEPGVQGTTNTASCLLEPAKKIALSFQWPADNNAPTKQIGFVSINFEY
ncbi:energy transducer TonB [Hanstruepera neustonica]|uniref:Energy transducer TonB n=1 Tax=Hanstruepera neustonica TaxID=1445657 RepID=A0A2K1DZK4_9FLAO|nr:cell envelope integrity protein TolA [Hanstruepera neustonica]PNQ73458.1 energy transducer TonB [Hanstruepera neustonica]